MGTSEFKPQLRKDLIVTEQQDRDQVYFVLKDRKSQKFFRLKRIEYLIATRLDGSRQIPELAAHLKEEFGIKVNEDILAKFVQKLQSCLLLENALLQSELNEPASILPEAISPEESAKLQSKPRQAVSSMIVRRSRFGKILYWKIFHFDPDEFFNQWLPRTSFFFSKAFIGLAAFTIFFGLCITAANWSQISQEITTLFSAQSIILAFAVMMPLVIFHELAHGMTCKHFGGEVHEMGFLLLYFQPSCFCNVSDSYLFKKKSQRIAVMAAGVFIQSFLWAVLTILWRILAPETWLAHLVFTTIAVTGVVTIFQFNPLLKLDGYYILAELFSVSNLRSKSFTYLRGKMRSLLLGANRVCASLARRERRIYWAYSLIALMYSINFLGYFFLKIERYFVQQYQGTGFIAFWGVALFVVSEPLVQSLGHILPKKEKATERKNTVARHKNLYVTSFLCLGGMLILTFGRWELKVSDQCVLIPYERADVRAEVPGIIDHIYFDEGQTVHAGDVIARLADYQLSAQKDKILAQISEAQAELQLMLAGPSKEEIALVQSQVDSADAAFMKSQAQIPIAKEQVDYARKSFNRFKKMFDEKLLASMSLDQAQRDLNLRERELIGFQHDVEEKRGQLQEAKRSLAKLMAGVRPEQIQGKRAEIEGLVAQEKQLEVESAYTAIRSPIDGVITTHFLKQKEGVYLQQGEVICQVANTRKIITEIPVPEKEVGDVEVGFPVRLKANAYPKLEFKGRVTQISDIADQRDQNVRVVMVRSEVDNPNFLLKPQMTGYAKIYCGKRTIGDLASRRMVRFIRTEFWSWF